MPFKKKRVLITAGGTGGHLYPAQALAQQLIKTEHSPDILFAAGGLATNRFFDRSSFLFREISCSTLSKNPFKFLKNSLRILNGVRQSLKIIRQYKPDIVVGFGSFYTIPVLIASKIYNIPFVLHEANSVPGKANRWFAPYAAFIGVHFPFTATHLKGQVVEVGLPLRETYQQQINKDKALEYYNLSKDSFTLLVFGGSQGATAINQLIEEALPYLNGLKIQFIHLVGQKDNLEYINALYKKYLFSAAVKVFEPQMQFAWKSADLFLGRSGASTVGEAIEVEVPGILIPYPHATEDHQNKNAEFFVQTVQGGIKLNQEDLTGQRLATEIKKLLFSNLLDSMKIGLKSYKNRPKLDLCQLVLKMIT